MTIRPSVGFPSWATNAAYASPGDSWDTDPTKVSPPAGLQAEGWEPTGIVPAEMMNWWKNNVGQWVEHFDRLKNIEFKNWREVETVRQMTSGNTIEDVAFHAHGGVGTSIGLHIAVGDQSGVTSNILRSVDGEMWEEVALATSTTHAYGIMYSSTIGLWAVVGNDNLIETAADGSSWTARTSAWGAGSTLFFVEEESGLFVVTGDDTIGAGDSQGGAAIQTSSNGTTWTNRTNPSSVILGRPGFGNSLWVIGGLEGVITSSDGLTWTDRTSLFSGLTNTNRIFDVHYSSVSGLWVACGLGDVGSGNNGTIWTTPDPDTTAWTARLNVTNLGEFTRIEEDAFGNLLTVNRNSAADAPTVFALSRDGGLNWETWNAGWNGVSSGAFVAGIARTRDRFTIFGEAAGLGVSVSDPFLAHSLKL